MKTKLASLATALLIVLSFTLVKEKPFAVPKGWPKPAYDFSRNPLREEIIALGRALFYDPILSIDSSISCSSCHSSYTAFAHVDHALSHGIYDRIGTRNAPALINLAWQRTFMWDGAINHLDVQALAPLNHPDEMGESTAHVLKKLKRSSLYKKLFRSTYSDTLINSERLLKSISQFMLSLVSSNSKYDQVLRGEIKFTEKEQKGYKLFKSYCSSCHAEPLFTTGEFANNGLAIDTLLRDTGRYKITGRSGDSLRFKIPTLRNIEFTFPYMHDGRFKNLNQVLNHYSSGITASPTLAKELKEGFVFNADEKVDLTSFLLCLSDKDFLFNTSFSYPFSTFNTVPNANRIK